MEDRMQIVVENRSPWIVMTLDGNLDAEAGPGVYLRFQRELYEGWTHFIFDLRGVRSVDSAGLGMLVRCYRDARGRGGEVHLRQVPDPIERVLEFTRLNTIFQTGHDAPGGDNGTGLQAA
jgi:anti-sigma B factor antagonist